MRWGEVLRAAGELQRTGRLDGNRWQYEAMGNGESSRERSSIDEEEWEIAPANTVQREVERSHPQLEYYGPLGPEPVCVGLYFPVRAAWRE